LTNVLGFTSILERTPLTSEQSEYLGLVRSGGNYLLMLLNDLLDYTSVSSGRLDLHPETISVSEVAHEIIATHTPEARAKSLDLDVDVDVDIPALIEADPGRLRQVLQNVVSNGIKFTDRGFVRLSVKAGKPGFLEFLVQDTGPGIPPDAIPHIFEAFGATSESNSRGHGGAKVGLAVTHKILERMGGTITVKSHPGIGSLFTISIPIGNPKPHVKAPTTQLPDREPSSMEFSTMNLKVLAVDDNDVNRKVLQRLLGMIGIQCDAATGGRECLEMSASHAYDVIFLDIQMPEMDGFETVGKLRAREKETGADPTHVIAYTAFTLPGDRDRCLKAGMNDYVSKPIRAGSLANAISAYLSASGKMSSGV
jgi:CheY-like chemotaxis protein